VTLRLRRAAAWAVALAGAMTAGVWIGARGGAASAPPPGSPGDPLVSRSYVTQALASAFAAQGGRVRTLTAGEAFTLAKGTLWTAVAGSVQVRVAVPAAGDAAATSAPGAPAVVDLSAAKPLAVATGGSAAPLDAMLVVTQAGVTLTAGSHGAVVFLLGAQATVALPASAH